MDASHWVLLVVGAVAGCALGFAVGRLSAGGSSASPLTLEKIEKIDAQATADRAAVDADVAARQAKAPSMGVKELTDALERDFTPPDPLPGPPLRGPDGK